MTPARIPLLLLPGMGCDARVWDPTVRRELQSVAQVHAVDVLLGRSVTVMADAILAARPGRFAVAGLSQGGIVALELAARAPHRILAVCAIGCSGRAPTPEQRAAWEELDQLAARGDFDTIGAALAQTSVPDDERVNLRPKITQMVRALGEKAFREQLAAQRSRIDRRAQLSQLRCPALFLAAADDRACPPDRVAELAALVPHAVFGVIPHAGHLCTLTRPAVVADRLRSWLRAVVPLALSLPPASPDAAVSAHD